MAKIFKISGYFVDPNGDFRPDDIKYFMDGLDLIPRYVTVEEKDIGEWHDANPLNHVNCPKCICDFYFEGF